MFEARRNRSLLTGILLAVAVLGVCLAQDCIDVRVNINPHRIVLNAQGKADDVQANIPMVLPSARIVDFAVTLSINDEEVIEAESARYCLIDDMLIIGFDRTDLQNNPVVQDAANTTVTAEVAGYVTVQNTLTLEETTTHFSGSDTVQIVQRGKKGR